MIAKLLKSSFGLIMPNSPRTFINLIELEGYEQNIKHGFNKIAVAGEFIELTKQHFLYNNLSFKVFYNEKNLSSLTSHSVPSNQLGLLMLKAKTFS